MNETIFIDEKSKILHRELLNTRHNFYAHAGICNYETFIPILLFNIENKNDFGFKTIKISFIKPHNEKIHEYILLIEKIIYYLNKKIEECGERLLKKDIRPNIDDLFQKALAKKQS